MSQKCSCVQAVSMHEDEHMNVLIIVRVPLCLVYLCSVLNISILIAQYRQHWKIVCSDGKASLDRGHLESFTT